MKCESFEMLMADALGNELAASDRPAFEAHLAECERCRAEYDSSRQAVDTLVSLPGPERVTVQRQGDRLVIETSRAVPRAVPRWIGSGLLRYAATILIAFLAGYGWHAGTTPTAVVTGSPDGGSPPPSMRDDFQQRLASVHARGPARSDLAKCLMAMADGRN